MRFLLFLSVFVFGCGAFILMFSGNSNAGDSFLKKGSDLMSEKPENGYEVATLGGGCFWCTESEYRGLDGVLFTRVGYMGGDTDNPSYRDITTGKTGHAEVVEITFDPEKLSYGALLEFFLTKAHDPTQLNRQGVDVGTQYRSVIFPHNNTQKETAQIVLKKVGEGGVYKKPIVTTIEPLSTFWVGEDYHQQYYEKYREETGKDHIRVILKNAAKLKK